MRSIIAEAPGKIVLLGEYAVVEGIPGLALAVDRHARVALHDCDVDQCRVEAPQIRAAPAAFELTSEGAIRWAEPPAGAFGRSAALIEHLLAEVRRRGGKIRPFRLHIDSGALFQTGALGAIKLGLGSSAAVAVALDAALNQAFGPAGFTDTVEDTVRRLLIPVRSAQGGSGSGIDLAASRAGGLIAYRIEEPEIEIETLRLPEDLHCLHVWTGAAASTTDFVTSWRRVKRDAPDTAEALLAEMAASVEAGMAALKSGDGAAFAAELGAYGRIMGKMNHLMHAPVFSAAHHRILEQASRLDVAYKPCGAGGGDLGIAASVQSDSIAELARRLRQQGLVTLALAPESRGVVVRQE